MATSLLLLAPLTAGCDDKPTPTPTPTPEPTPTPTPEPTPTPTPTPEPLATCDIDPMWFTTPAMPDGSKFPDNSTVTNCDFHRWSVQSFAWLTSKQGERTVFEGFADPANLFVPGGPKLEYPGRDVASAETMLPRWAKNSSTADLSHIFQAGPGGEILVDQLGEVVYYSNHLDSEFWKFIDTNKFWDLATLEGVEKGSDNDLDFPVNTFELKSSWRVAEKDGKVLIPDADKRFYVIETTIPLIEVNKKTGRASLTKKTAKAKMALVGLHVTGIVAHHPEFIWATFEHIDNAPDCKSFEGASGEAEAKPQWSLCSATATRDVCNQFDPNNPLGPVNVCRAQPQGGGSDAGPDNNQDNIKGLDAQLREQTKDTVWANYTYVGAIWTTGVVPLNNPTSEDLRGSLMLGNTTMETFKQDENCFSCHNAGVHDVTAGAKTVQVQGKNINLSHFVVNYQAVQMASKSGK